MDETTPLLTKRERSTHVQDDDELHSNRSSSSQQTSKDRKDLICNTQISFDDESKNVECEEYHYGTEHNRNVIQKNNTKASKEAKHIEQNLHGHCVQQKNNTIQDILLGSSGGTQFHDEHKYLTEKDDKVLQPKLTYLSLVKSNKPFQLYLSSYIITQIGEWFTYVATIEQIEQILGPEKSISSRRYISYLVVFRLLPFLFVTPFGGVLADIRDRRKSMILLDWIGCIAPLLLLLGAHFHSITIIFIVTGMQSTIAAFYEPCRNAIIPLLVVGDEEMQKATTLAGLVWSVMAALGAATGGFMVSIVGIKWCFLLDSCTFVCSALILMLMEGEWDTSNQTKENVSILNLVHEMIVGGAKYIRSSTFWPLVFMKVTASVIYGGADVLNVSFSEKGHGNDEADNSRRLGALFFCVGFGCYIGPVVADNWSSMKNMNTILNACVVAFGIQGIGLLGMGYFEPFYYVCFFTIVRSAGSSIAWIDSSILLQTFSKPEMLGRVMAVDYGLALTGESLSALIVGILQDKWGISAMEVCFYMGYIAIFLFIVWLVYRVREPKYD